METRLFWVTQGAFLEVKSYGLSTVAAKPAPPAASTTRAATAGGIWKPRPRRRRFMTRSYSFLSINSLSVRHHTNLTAQSLTNMAERMPSIDKSKALN